MSEWPVVKLADVCEVFDGPHATPKKTADGPWFLSIGSLSNGRLDLAQSSHLSEEDFHKWTRRVTPRPGDVLFSYETRLGEAALMPEGLRACLGRRMGLLRAYRNVVTPRYLLYAYLGPEFQEQIKQRSIHGATVDRIPIGELPEWEIRLPPRAIQDRLAALLGALDDKIAANEQVTNLALDLADSYFREAVRGVALGSATFDEVAAVRGGGTPRTTRPDYWDGSILWATPSDLTALSAPYLFSTARRITKAGLDNCASEIYRPGSILMTSRATIGVFALAQAPVAVNQGFIVVDTPADELRWWLFHEMRSRVDEMVSLANGSTFLELSRKNFKVMKVRLPDEDKVAAFAAKVAPLHIAAARRAEESRMLAELRDALLPGLMSGKIKVREAEAVVEEAI